MDFTVKSRKEGGLHYIGESNDEVVGYIGDTDGVANQGIIFRGGEGTPQYLWR